MTAEDLKIPENLQIRVKKLMDQYSLSRWIIFFIDNAVSAVAFIAAYFLRYNLIPSDIPSTLAVYHGIVTLSVYALFYLIFRSYTGLLRHTTVIDLLTVLMATTFAFLSLIGMSLIFRLFTPSESYVVPLSILMIHFVLVTVALFFFRLMVKTFFHLMSSTYTKKKKVLIYGAGDLGVIVKRVIQSDVQGNYQISGFLDDNKSLQGKKLNGIQVYSRAELSREFVERYRIRTLIFADKDLSQNEKSEIIFKALDFGLEILETPAIDKWLDGKLKLQQIQKVKIEDLLGRDPIRLNMERIRAGIDGRTILVTGATGSIGSEIVRQLYQFSARKIVLIDQAETPMFHLERELLQRNRNIPVEMILGDVTNQDKMERIFREYRPEVVFHAAAYKHVPILESNPYEAIRVNVGGTRTIADLSAKYNVRKFVMISTDKAVNPANVMGASKRMCEMVVQLKSRRPGNQTQFVITRFGNVLGSNGSVIPIFAAQIEQGGPVTVTHPEITRYFMTIPEACQLVLEAGFMGQGGEIFEFDMGKPVKIVDLANQMIRLSGFIPDKDIKIEFTGLRPGEKLYEELLTDQEKTKPTHHPKIKIAGVQLFEQESLAVQFDCILMNLYNYDKAELISRCREIVPEFQNQQEHAEA